MGGGGVLLLLWSSQKQGLGGLTEAFKLLGIRPHMATGLLLTIAILPDVGTSLLFPLLYSLMPTL